MRRYPITYGGCICVTGSGACTKQCKACRLIGHLFTCPRSAPNRWIGSDDPVVAREAARAKVRLASARVVAELLALDG